MQDYGYDPYNSGFQSNLEERPGFLVAAFILDLITSVISILVGIFYLSNPFILGDFSSIDLPTIYTFGGIFLGIGVILFIFSMFLLGGKNYARILSIIFLSIDFIVPVFLFLTLPISTSLAFILAITIIPLNILSIVWLSISSVRRYFYYMSGLITPPPPPPPPPTPPPAPNPTVYELGVTPGFGVLIAEKGPIKGQTFKLDPNHSYIIGRSGDIALPENDHLASREHAKIRNQGGKFVLYDMGSTNHTYVNNEKIDSKVLQDNDRIKVGSTIFRFQWVRKKH